MSASRHPNSSLPDESFQLVAALRESLASGVVVVSWEERIISFSPEAALLLGWEAAAPAGGTLASFPFELQDIVHSALARRTPLTVESILLTLEARIPRRFQVQAVPIQLADDNWAVVLTLADVTGVIRLQQSLERLDQLATAGTLAAGMAHEVKNALVAIKTFVDLLLEKNKDDELAGLVRREMDRVNAIIRQLLKFGGAPSPERTAVRLHDVLEHSLRMVQHQLDGKLISLRRAFQAAPDAVTGDDRQLEQVFVNLFMNAVDASGANGSLSVETEFISAATPDIARPECVGRPHVRVTVADSGVGISPEHLPRLFQPFFTTKQHGTGLGLPITRRIVEAHAGQITVESRPNEGTTIRVSLPAGSPA